MVEKLPEPKPLTPELSREINQILGKYIKRYGELLDEKKLIRTNFALFKPNNRFITIDEKTIHFIFSFNNAIPGMSNVSMSDLTEFGKVHPQELISASQQQLGFKEIHYFSLPRELIEMDEETKIEAIDKICNEHLDREFKQLIRQTRALYISPDKIRKYISTLTEEIFTQEILVPLLTSMGFEKVRYTGHDEKILEFGKDIRMLKLRIPTGNFLYFAAQVKSGKIHSAVNKPSKNIAGILNQIRMIFDNPIFDYDTNSELYVDHALLISSGKITKSARNYLQTSLHKEKRRNIMFLDNEDMLALIEKYGLPLKTQQKIDNAIK